MSQCHDSYQPVDGWEPARLDEEDLVVTQCHDQADQPVAPAEGAGGPARDGARSRGRAPSAGGGTSSPAGAATPAGVER